MVSIKQLVCGKVIYTVFYNFIIIIIKIANILLTLFWQSITFYCNNWNTSKEQRNSIRPVF